MEAVSPAAVRSRSPVASVTTDATSLPRGGSEEPSSRGAPSDDAEKLQEFSTTLHGVLEGMRGRSDARKSGDGGTDKRPAKPNGIGRDELCSRSLEDRFEFVRLCLAAAGFSSIDSMVGEYYTAEFSHDSPVAREQRVSRHSQLPLLVARLRESARTWSQWESHGYQSEIMTSAVSLVQDEQRAFVAPKRLFADARSELEKARPGEGPTSGRGDARRSSSSSSSSSSGTFQLLTRTLQDRVSSSPWITSPRLSQSNRD